MDVDTPVRAHPGNDWLTTLSPSPKGIRRSWEAGNLARLCVPSDGSWTVGELGLIRTLAAMDPLQRSRLLGPVLASPNQDRAWWLLPAAAREHLADIPDLTLYEPGDCFLMPPATLPMHSRGWIESPDGRGRLTDPAALGAVLSRTFRLTPEDRP